VTSTWFESASLAMLPCVHLADAVLEMTCACAAGIAGSKAAATAAVTYRRDFEKIIAVRERAAGPALAGPATPSHPIS
jgi:hypothetical protein